MGDERRIVHSVGVCEESHMMIFSRIGRMNIKAPTYSYFKVL